MYCNQRHLAFTLGVLLFVLILFTPHLYAMVGRLRLEWENIKKAEKNDRGKRPLFLRKERGDEKTLKGIVTEDNLDVLPEQPKKAAGDDEMVGVPEEEDPQIQKHIKFFLRRSLFAVAGWKFANPVAAVFAGVLLGALSFWNGAVTIAALLVLFIMAAVSDHRLDFLVAAIFAVGLALLQSMAFIDGSAVSTSFYYGFISENRTVFGVIDYIFRLTGPALFVTAAAFILLDVHGRIMTAAFAAPFLFAFHMSLTTDVTVNHKYIMISMMLFGIVEAYLLVRMWEQKKIAVRVAAVGLVCLLTVTGIFDYITVLNRNQKQNNLAFDTQAPVTAWIRENATAQDIFLTSNYALNNVVLGGAMLYNGWQYFAWSAGYDTAYRDGQVCLMYEAESPQELAELVAKNNIRYIIVDHDNRTSADYEVREDVIAAAYEPVYTQDAGDWKLTIYDVQKPLF